MDVEAWEESRSGTIMVELIEGDESWVEGFHHCCSFPEMRAALSSGRGGGCRLAVSHAERERRIPEERTALSRLCLVENL